MTATTLTALRILPLPAAALDRLHRTGNDEHGNPFVARHAEGGEPLRCCLRDAGAGERIALIAYAPPGGRAGYAEVGPVFVHARACSGPATDAYPEDFHRRRQVLRAYSTDGTIAGGTVAEPNTDHLAQAAELLADSTVALVQTRNVVYGCYMLTITRAS
jgi:hypothetical protein